MFTQGKSVEAKIVIQGGILTCGLTSLFFHAFLTDSNSCIDNLLHAEKLNQLSTIDFLFSIKNITFFLY